MTISSFILNLKFSMTKFENLKWQVSEVINFITFRKFVTQLVQNLPNILSFWTNNVTNFPKVMKLMCSLTCHFWFSIFVIENMKFEWQCSQYLELNPTCETMHYHHTYCFLYSDARRTVPRKVIKVHATGQRVLIFLIVFVFKPKWGTQENLNLLKAMTVIYLFVPYVPW